MMVGLAWSLPLNSTSAMPVRTAALCAWVGVLAAVSAAPVTVSTPVTKARWHNALSSPKSCTPVEGDVASCQERAPPADLL